MFSYYKCESLLKIKLLTRTLITFQNYHFFYLKHPMSCISTVKQKKKLEKKNFNQKSLQNLLKNWICWYVKREVRREIKICGEETMEITSKRELKLFNLLTYHIENHIQKSFNNFLSSSLCSFSSIASQHN